MSARKSVSYSYKQSCSADTNSVVDWRTLRLPGIAWHTAIRVRRLHASGHEQLEPFRRWPLPQCVHGDFGAHFSGGFVGAGAETKLTDHISIRGEYRWTDFGSGQLGLPTVNGINLNDFVSARASPTMQDGRVSLNYRF